MTFPGRTSRSLTEQCLRNVDTILRAGPSDLAHVLKVSVFLTDMDDFQRMNGVYERMFGSHRPARTTIAAAALPAKGLRVEIDCIAYVVACAARLRTTVRIGPPARTTAPGTGDQVRHRPGRHEAAAEHHRCCRHPRRGRRAPGAAGRPGPACRWPSSATAPRPCGRESRRCARRDLELRPPAPPS